MSESGTNCRYGITMNNENECLSNDSSIGFGCHSNITMPTATQVLVEVVGIGSHPHRGWIFVR